MGRTQKIYSCNVSAIDNMRGNQFFLQKSNSGQFPHQDLYPQLGSEHPRVRALGTSEAPGFCDFILTASSLVPMTLVYTSLIFDVGTP